MGCAHSKNQKRRQDPSSRSMGSTRANVTGPSTEGALDSEAILLVDSQTNFDEKESPVIWFHETIEEGTSSWTEVYLQMVQKSYGDALLSLCDFPVRNWARKWKKACVAARKCYDESTEDDRPISNTLPVADFIKELISAFFTSSNRCSGEDENALWGQKQQLKLQEQLIWMTKIVLSAVTSEHSTLLHHIYFALTQKQEDCDWITTGEASDFEKLRVLCIKGFVLNGVFFRLIVGDDDRKAVRAACRGNTGLVVCVEYKGMRMLASSVLPVEEFDPSTHEDVVRHAPFSISPLYLCFEPQARSPTILTFVPGAWQCSSVDLLGLQPNLYVEDSVEDAKRFVLEFQLNANQWTMENLQDVASSLCENAFSREECVVRDALHAHRLPARAAIGLLGCHYPSKNASLLVPISCDIVARVVKRLLRFKFCSNKFSELEDLVGSLALAEGENDLNEDKQSELCGNFNFDAEICNLLSSFFPVPRWSRLLFLAFWVEAVRGLPCEIDAENLSSWINKAYVIAMRSPLSLARSLSSHIGVQVDYGAWLSSSFHKTPPGSIDLSPVFKFKTLAPIVLDFATIQIDETRSKYECLVEVKKALRLLHWELFPEHQIFHIVTLLKTVRWVLLKYFTPLWRQNGEAKVLRADLENIRNLLTDASIQISNILCCPPELLAALWSLRAYSWEVQGEVDVCFMDYLQAYQLLQDVWGDATSADCVGHPFSFFLTWKLGHIAYLRSDLKNIDKFSDHFRALRRTYESPFPWSPPYSLHEHMDDLDDEAMARIMCYTEQKFRSSDDALSTFYNKFDPLNFASGISLTSHQRKKEVGRLESGTVFSLGSNESAQLGCGPPHTMESIDSKERIGEQDIWWTGRPLRVLLDIFGPVKQVSCADDYSAALTEDGDVYLWGQFCDSILKCPEKCMLPLKIDKISCGAGFFLMMDANNGLWSMGHGRDGLLGVGPRPEIFDGVDTPLKLAEYEVVDISCGGYHACCVTRSGRVLTWGRAEGGQLGHSTKRLDELLRGNENTPFEGDTVVTLPTEVHSEGEFVHAACGQVHCVALDSLGQVWSWGWGEFGQLGNGLSQTSLHRAKVHIGDTGVTCRRDIPERIDSRYFNHERVIHVSGGGNFTLAVTATLENTGGRLFAFGGNEWGQCGLPANQPYDIDIPTVVEALVHTQIRSCAAGDNHALAFDIEGNVFAWGNAQFGQIGNINPPRVLSPPPVLDTRYGRIRSNTVDDNSPVRHRQAFANYETPRKIQSAHKLWLSSGACGAKHSLILHRPL